ncbi:MAG: hypothetical protein IJC20_00465, partial [Clostridia bacterium]|nr:hypothetical protein [Clostridia bacterium]
MATIINNRATVNYRYGTNTATTVSNVTSVDFQNALSIQKTSLSDSYRIGQDITYIIALQNGSDNELTVDATDDLGTYTFNGNEYTPLTFTGDAQLFINGVFVSDLTPTVSANELVFENIVLPPNANAFILYSATVNEFANVGEDGEITNTVTADVTCDCPCAETVSDSNTITAEEFADLRLVKSACPNTVICGEEITYVIDVLNYGNMAATEVVITDTFD